MPRSGPAVRPASIEGGTLLVGEGKIVAVGKDVAIPEGAVVIDAAGKHISPGIIDCHSHMATDGGVNEGTQAITAEVRIGDFIDADDIKHLSPTRRRRDGGRTSCTARPTRSAGRTRSSSSAGARPAKR